MKYQEAIKQEMEELAKDPKVIFLGYNVLYGSQGYGTFKDVPKEKCIETPLAENLMAGLAIGLAMEGFKPVLFFERHDFMLIALDALVNHLDKIESMSNKQFTAPIIIRAVVGATKPLYPGPQHLQDFSEIFKKLFHFPVYSLNNYFDIRTYYAGARNFDKPVMFIEKKDLYPEEYR
jgi:pyruvate dehydrogenase E1 component beta subunit